jgi:hypothetical protein
MPSFLIMGTTLIFCRALDAAGVPKPRDREARRMPSAPEAARFNRTPSRNGLPTGRAVPAGIVPIFWPQVHLARNRCTAILKGPAQSL